MRNYTRRLFGVSIAILVGSLCSPSCASAPTTAKVGVSSFASPSIPDGGTYHFIADMAGVDQNDLQFQEACSYLRPVLSAQGLVETDDNKNTDIIISVAYGLGEPITQTRTVPTYGQTSGGIATFSATTNGPYGTNNSSGTIFQQPTFGITGTTSRTSITMPKFLRLSAIDFRKFLATRETVYFWQIGSVTGGSNGDLRAAIPIMAASMVDFIGKSTGGTIWLQLSEDSPNVRLVRRINN